MFKVKRRIRKGFLYKKYKKDKSNRNYANILCKETSGPYLWNYALLNNSLTT